MVIRLNDNLESISVKLILPGHEQFVNAMPVAELNQFDQKKAYDL